MPFNDPPWHPMTDPIDKKTIGKLLEELGELTSALSRCLIQGIHEVEPVTGKPNKQWVKEEVLDVMVGMHLLDERFMFNFMDDEGLARFNRKIEGLRSWHKGA